MDGTCRVPIRPVLNCRVFPQTGHREDHARLLPTSRCVAGIYRRACREISLQLTFCLYEFVLQVTMLTDKIFFPLMTSMSNCLSVLGGAGKVCRGSARLWNTSWEGNPPCLCDCICVMFDLEHFICKKKKVKWLLSIDLQLSCHEDPVNRYCREERLRHRAFLFRYTLSVQEGEETIKSGHTVALVKLKCSSALLCFYLSFPRESLTRLSVCQVR